MRRAEALAVLLGLGLLACDPEVPPEPAEVTARYQPFPTRLQGWVADSDDGPQEWLASVHATQPYRLVAEENADAVLVVEFLGPGGGVEGQFRFPLARNADSTQTGFVDQSLQGGIACGTWNDPGVHGAWMWASIVDATRDALTVEVTLHGGDTTGGAIDASQRLAVPWLGHATKRLAKKVLVSARFERNKGM